MIDQFKQQQLLMKDFLKDDYEQAIRSQRVEKDQWKKRELSEAQLANQRV